VLNFLYLGSILVARAIFVNRILYIPDTLSFRTNLVFQPNAAQIPYSILLRPQRIPLPQMAHEAILDPTLQEHNLFCCSFSPPTLAPALQEDQIRIFVSFISWAREIEADGFIIANNESQYNRPASLYVIGLGRHDLRPDRFGFFLCFSPSPAIGQNGFYKVPIHAINSWDRVYTSPRFRCPTHSQYEYEMHLFVPPVPTEKTSHMRLIVDGTRTGRSFETMREGVMGGGFHSSFANSARNMQRFQQDLAGR
jgi:hypothetical protein